MKNQIKEMARIACPCNVGGMCNADNKLCDLDCSEGKEFGKLYNAGYLKSSDVAREIVNDVKETLLDFHLREDKKYSASKTKKRKQFDIETARYRAITDAIKFAIEALNEVEKKYESEGVE